LKKALKKGGGKVCVRKEHNRGGRVLGGKKKRSRKEKGQLGQSDESVKQKKKGQFDLQRGGFEILSESVGGKKNGGGKQQRAHCALKKD